MIEVEAALKIILSSLKPTAKISLNIRDALGMTLAQDLYAQENIPPWDNSAMDGYAIRSKDSHGASQKNPKILKVIEDLPAGYFTKKKVSTDTAIRIMTGAPIPKGADAVIMVEDTRIKSEIRNPKSETNPKSQIPNKEFIEIFKEVKTGDNVRYAGEDVKKGELVIKKGSILKSGHIGMLASLGFSKVKVYQKPKVAILATGDELLEINQRLSPGKIRNSNSYSLYAQVLRAGALPILIGIARDRKQEIEAKIKKGLTADMLLVSGGISVGDYDFVKDVLNNLGVVMKFWKVAIRPGKPLAFGLIGKTPVFGLPGNPVSSMVAFEQFVRPAILKMAGAKDLFRFHLPAIFKENFQKKKGLRYFLRVILENKEGLLYASLTGPQGSGILKSCVLANGIMELPEEITEVRSGDRVKVTYLD